LVTGRILQFDQARGYGFVAADDDGDDVFLHASVFDGDTDELRSGKRVEFKVMAGDRGRKAFAARFIADQPDMNDEPALLPRPVASALPVAPPAVQRLPAPAPHEEDASDEEPMCDVLSTAEFGQELTELLLDHAPVLTGQQIRQVRQSVLEFAGKHGWVDI
jgi:cold shock protein